ncbi:MAG TPA: hypothetical protein VFG30_22475 [Polyangiales bacterium]|nr:hypothetical protein [Polyangiales bacterium]
MQADETLSLKPTRASFIRSLPEAMPVEEVIERGREIGLVINPSDVHSVRYYMRQSTKGEPTRKSTASTASTAATSATSATSTSTLDRAGIAATVKRNYELIEAQQTDLPDHSPAPVMNGKKKRATNGAEPVTRAQPIVKERPKRRPFATPIEIRAMEQQLRTIVARIGTDRAREILDELEALPIE